MGNEALPTEPAVVLHHLDQTWELGDYAEIESRLTLVSELLCEAVDLRIGQRVLDVITGSGNTALAAARRGADVTGIDAVPSLLVRARERAAAERLPVVFEVGTPEALPFEDGAFDTVLGTFRLLFASDPARAAGELLRVCRAGGMIGLATWSAAGMIGEFTRIVTQHVLPSFEGNPILQWGTETGLRTLFGDAVSSLHITPRQVVLRHWSPHQYVTFLWTFYGPLRRALELLGPARQQRLVRDLEDLVQRSNRSGDETLLAPVDYLEVVAIKA